MSYSAWLTLALVCGLGLTTFETCRRNLPLARVLDAALVALAIGVIGARAGYVASHWAYFRNYPGKAIQWWQGGLAWHTGLVTGLLGVVIYAHWQRLPTLRLLDVFAPGLAVGCGLGWLACHSANRAYGVPVWPDQPLWFVAADLPDMYSVQEPRVAVQLLGAGWAIIVLGVVLKSFGRLSPPGVGFATFTCLYSAGLFGLGFVRGDEAMRLGSLRLDQVADAILVSAGAMYLIFRSRTQRATSNKQRATSNKQRVTSNE